MSVWWYIKVKQSTGPFMNAPGNGPGSGEKVNCKLNRSLAWDDDRDTQRLRRRRPPGRWRSRQRRRLRPAAAAATAAAGRAAVTGAPVANWHGFNTHYTERCAIALFPLLKKP
jgi:hypothetical protein